MSHPVCKKNLVPAIATDSSLWLLWASLGIGRIWKYLRKNRPVK